MSLKVTLLCVLTTQQVVTIVTKEHVIGNLAVFLFLSGSSSSNGGVTNPLCGAGGYSVSQGQGASFFCRPSLYGRYVTIRSTLNDPLTLCEVEVYTARRGMLSSTVTDLLRPILFLPNIDN